MHPPTIAAPVLPPPGSSQASAAVAPDVLAVLDDPVEQRRFTRFQTDAAGRSVADSALCISGMHCAACAGLIEQAVARVGGVLDATVSASGERARVRWLPGRTRLTDIVAAIRAAGYDATPDTALVETQALLAAFHGPAYHSPPGAYDEALDALVNALERELGSVR
jgi:copper chaperone CopZ